MLKKILLSLLSVLLLVSCSVKDKSVIVPEKNRVYYEELTTQLNEAFELSKIRMISLGYVDNNPEANEYAVQFFNDSNDFRYTLNYSTRNKFLLLTFGNYSLDSNADFLNEDIKAEYLDKISGFLQVLFELTKEEANYVADIVYLDLLKEQSNRILFKNGSISAHGPSIWVEPKAILDVIK